MQVGLSPGSPGGPPHGVVARAAGTLARMTARSHRHQPDNRRRPTAPARFALDRQTWKEIAHLLANLPMAIVGFVYVVTVVSVGAGLSVTVIGLPLLAAGLMGARLSAGSSGRGRAGTARGAGRRAEPDAAEWPAGAGAGDRVLQAADAGAEGPGRLAHACCTTSSGCRGAS